MCDYSAVSGGMKACLLFLGKANGSSDRLVADMDDQSRQVEDGIASALCHSLPLFNMVIRDAAAQTTRPVCYCFSFLFPFSSLFSILCCCCIHLTPTDTLKQACGMLVALVNLLSAVMSPLFLQLSEFGADKHCMVLIAASMGISGQGKAYAALASHATVTGNEASS